MTQTETFAPAFPDNHGWLPWACWAVLGGDTLMLATWREEYRLLPLDAAKAAFKHGLMDEDTASMLIDPSSAETHYWSITLPGVMGWRLTAEQYGGFVQYGVRNGSLYAILGSG